MVLILACFKELTILETWWTVLCKLEEDMQFSQQLKSKWAGFWWPAMQWCRELMVRLYEVGFKPPLSAMVLDKIKLFQNAMLVSLPCERGGNKLRRLVSCI